MSMGEIEIMPFRRSAATTLSLTDSGLAVPYNTVETQGSATGAIAERLMRRLRPTKATFRRKYMSFACHQALSVFGALAALASGVSAVFARRSARGAGAVRQGRGQGRADQLHFGGDFFQAYQAGAEAQAKALGVDLRIFPGRQHAAEEREQINQAINLGVRAS